MRALLIGMAFTVLLSIGGASAAEFKGQQIPVCGGFPGLTCGDKEWCDFPIGAICGEVDQFGTCRARPEKCTEQVVWVCGCDGKTYSNSCFAQMAGADVAHAGRCGKEE